MTLPARSSHARRWHGAVLVAAGVYNLAWGAAVVAMPHRTMSWLVAAPESGTLWPELWQCIGMIVGVYGVGYLVAARDPLRHWPIVLVGLLGKLLGPIGFVNGALAGRMPWTFGWTNLTNDVVWWVPFALILLAARRANHADAALSPAPSALSRRRTP